MPAEGAGCHYSCCKVKSGGRNLTVKESRPKAERAAVDGGGGGD